MAYKFINDTVGFATLSAAILASDTSITVDDASKLPAITGPDVFVALIDSELILVTSVTGNVLTVTRGSEGTTAAAHSASAVMKNVITRDALDSFSSGASFAYGVLSARPSPSGSAAYYSTDKNVLSVDDGTWHNYLPLRTQHPISSTDTFTVYGGGYDSNIDGTRSIITTSGQCVYYMTIPTSSAFYLDVTYSLWVAGSLEGSTYAAITLFNSTDSSKGYLIGHRMQSGGTMVYSFSNALGTISYITSYRDVSGNGYTPGNGGNGGPFRVVIDCGVTNSTEMKIYTGPSSNISDLILVQNVPTSNFGTGSLPDRFGALLSKNAPATAVGATIYGYKFY